MKKIILSALIGGLLPGGFGIAAVRADEPKPMAIIAFSGYDELMTDVECIGKLSDQPDLVKTLEGLIAAQTQGKGLAGLDKSRPWGVVVLAGDAPMPTGYAFIPVTRLEELLDALKNLGMEISDPSDGVSEISGPNDQKAFVKQQGDWAYVCMSKEGFADVAADPAGLLGDAAKQYNFSARLLIKNIPPQLREMAMGMLQMGMQAGMEKMPDESDENFTLRMKVAEDSIEQTKKVLEEMDSIFIGAAVDEKTGSAYVDLEQTAVAGTDAAKQMSAIKKGKTDFGGFYQPQAVITACSFASLDKKQQEQMKNTLAMYRIMLQRAVDEQELEGEKKAKAKQVTDDIIKVFEDAIAAGKMDVGVSVSLAPAKSTLIGGVGIADGAAVDKVVRELAAIAKQEQPQAAGMFELDAAEHAGIKFHSLRFPLPELGNGGTAETVVGEEAVETYYLPSGLREQIAALVGKEVKLVLGVADKQVYLGVGEGALDKLKAAIDRSKSEADSEVLPVRMSFSATPVAKLVGDVAEDFTVKIAASSVCSALETAGGDDHVTLSGDSIPNGVRYRLTFQKGIMKILGMVPAMGLSR